MQRRSSLEARLVVNIIGGFWIEVEEYRLTHAASCGGDRRREEEEDGC